MILVYIYRFYSPVRYSDMNAWYVAFAGLAQVPVYILHIFVFPCQFTVVTNLATPRVHIWEWSIYMVDCAKHGWRGG
jgi:hypothetical protein